MDYRRLAQVTEKVHWPFGHSWAGGFVEPWISCTWAGRPWWPLPVTYEFMEDVDLSLLPWPLLVVEKRDWELMYVLMRRDGLLLFPALAAWLWYQALRPAYWRFVRLCFQVARYFGYGYVHEALMWRWRDLFVRQPCE